MNTASRITNRATYFLAILIGSITAVAASGGDMAGAQSALSSLQVGNRPADLYKLQYQSEATICDPILRSLNKPATLGGPAYAGVNAAQDLLLASELEVSWQRGNVGGTDSLDYSPVDLANDGVTKYVYRWSYGQHDRVVASLFILDRPIDDWTSKRSLPESVLRELIERSRPDMAIITDGINGAIRALDRSTVEDELGFNLLRVLGKTVILVSPSYDLTYAINPPGKQFKVFALFYHDNSTSSVVCEFTGSP